MKLGRFFRSFKKTDPPKLDMIFDVEEYVEHLKAFHRGLDSERKRFMELSEEAGKVFSQKPTIHKRSLEILSTRLKNFVQDVAELKKEGDRLLISLKNSTISEFAKYVEEKRRLYASEVHALERNSRDEEAALVERHKKELANLQEHNARLRQTLERTQRQELEAFLEAKRNEEARETATSRQVESELSDISMMIRTFNVERDRIADMIAKGDFRTGVAWDYWKRTDEEVKEFWRKIEARRKSFQGETMRYAKKSAEAQKRLDAHDRNRQKIISESNVTRVKSGETDVTSVEIPKSA